MPHAAYFAFMPTTKRWTLPTRNVILLSCHTRLTAQCTSATQCGGVSLPRIGFSKVSGNAAIGLHATATKGPMLTQLSRTSFHTADSFVPVHSYWHYPAQAVCHNLIQGKACFKSAQQHSKGIKTIHVAAALWTLQFSKIRLCIVCIAGVSCLTNLNLLPP